MQASRRFRFVERIRRTRAAIAKVLYESFAEYIWYSPITIAKDVLRKQ